MGPVLLVVMLLVVLVYQTIGTLLFMALEAAAEIDRQTDLLAAMNELLERHRCLDRQKMMKLMDFIDRDLDTARYVLHHNITYNVMWDWSGAASFVVSVITTIGYGHITPRTAQGKIACMIYAIIGIPLLLVFLKGAGEMLLKVCGRCLRPSCHCLSVSKCRHRLVVVLQSLLGLVILFILPVAVNVHHEGWSILDAIYSCFITLTTIGFGDFVAGNPADRESFEQSSGMLAYRLVNLLWTLVGLAYISMLITAISNYYVSKTHGVKVQAKRSMQKLRRCVSRRLECEVSTCSISTQTDTGSISSTLSSSLSPTHNPNLASNVATDLQVRLLAFFPVPDKAEAETAAAAAATSASSSSSSAGPRTPAPSASVRESPTSDTDPPSDSDPSSEVKDPSGVVTSWKTNGGTAHSNKRPKKVNVSTITRSNGFAQT